jgi:hypothetical protein
MELISKEQEKPRKTLEIKGLDDYEGQLIQVVASDPSDSLGERICLSGGNISDRVVKNKAGKTLILEMNTQKTNTKISTYATAAKNVMGIAKSCDERERILAFSVMSPDSLMGESQNVSMFMEKFLNKTFIYTKGIDICKMDADAAFNTKLTYSFSEMESILELKDFTRASDCEVLMDIVRSLSNESEEYIVIKETIIRTNLLSTNAATNFESYKDDSESYKFRWANPGDILKVNPRNSQRYGDVAWIIVDKGTNEPIEWVAQKRYIDPGADIVNRLYIAPKNYFKYRDDIRCDGYRGGGPYGPSYDGKLSLKSYNKWDNFLNKKFTDTEKDIIIGVSENEGKGNFDHVQAYDSEIVTVGAMQKTINPDGYGEFPKQMAKFKAEYPEKFRTLFEIYGWTVNNEMRVYYDGKTGNELKAIIRNGYNGHGCSESSFNEVVLRFPIESLINAASDQDFQTIQVNDFIDRLKIVMEIKPNDHDYKLGDYLKSKLGKATALDHHINRPGNVENDFFNYALNDFYTNNSNVSKNPNEWGINHGKYEQKIIDYYGKNRSGTDMECRYKKLKKYFQDSD